MEQPSLVPWLESHIQTSNAYRIIDQYALYIEGLEYRVEIRDIGVDSPYRYTVHVIDVTTGQVSDLGDGGATPEEALDVFHWQLVKRSGGA